MKDLFISYNRADELWARTLAERIEVESFDESENGRRLTVFFAPWDIEVGANFVNTLVDGLRMARFFSPIMSPEFFASGWTNYEWTDQVALDPTNASGRILPILLRNSSLDGRNRISIPPPFNVLNRLDFRDQNNFECRFGDLLRVLRGQAKARGSLAVSRQPKLFERLTDSNTQETAAPASTDEILLTNLVSISDQPEQIWSGQTKIRKRSDIWEKTRTNESFILKEGKLLAFCNLANEQCSLYSVIEEVKTVSPMAREALCSTKDGRLRYVELLNNCVAQHLRERRVGRDGDGRFYFWPDRDSDGNNVTRHHALGRERGREVAARKIRPDTGEAFWVHYSCNIRFEFLGDKLFLRIEPGYIFTKDGKVSMDPKTVGKLSIQWTGKQQNPDLLRLALFWVRVLADGKSEILIPAGSYTIKAKAFLASARAHFGVAGDYIRIQALMQQPGQTLDDVVDDIEIIESDIVDSIHTKEKSIEE